MMSAPFLLASLKKTCKNIQISFIFTFLLRFHPCFEIRIRLIAKPAGLPGYKNRVDIEGTNNPDISNAVAMILRKLFPNGSDDSYYPPDASESQPGGSNAN